MKTAMKTAMQELEDWVNNHQEPIFGMDLEIKINELLKKEKEQMVDFVFFAYQGVSQKCEVPKNLIAESRTIFEANFDRIYNQNK